MLKLVGIFALSASLGQALNLNASKKSAVNIKSYIQGLPDFEQKGYNLTGYWNDYQPSSYEEELIIAACKVSRATYYLNDTNSIMDDTLTSAQRFFVGDGSFGFTGIYETSQKKKLAFVAFRGSMTEADWMDNLDFGREDDTYTGFYNRIEESFSTWRDQLVALKQSNPDLKDVMFTGHSLGGAESNVAAVKLGENRPKKLRKMKIHVINFGSPRPGGKEFQARFRKNVVLYRRIVNAGDNVANLPPSASGFSHPDNGLWIWASTSGMNLVEFDTNNYPIYGGMSMVNYYAARANRELGFDMPEDSMIPGHHIELYLHRLEKILPRGAELVGI